MKKSWSIAIFLLSLFTLPCFGVTYTVNTANATITTYSGTTVSITVTLTVTRSASGAATPIYLLVSGAGLDGNYLVGSRRVYQGGSTTGNSIQVYLRPSSGTTDIGTTNTSGTTVTSATFLSSSLTRTITVKFVTATGKVPRGSPTTYTNSFQFQLYTGSFLAESGTLESGAVGTINTSITCTNTDTFSMALGTSSVSFGSPPSYPDRAMQPRPP
jgi:hypothetical protein